MKKLKDVIGNFENEIPLDQKYKPHKLLSNWKDHFECHVESDCLLIYRVDQTKKELLHERSTSIYLFLIFHLGGRSVRLSLIRPVGILNKKIFLTYFPFCRTMSMETFGVPLKGKNRIQRLL